MNKLALAATLVLASSSVALAQSAPTTTTTTTVTTVCNGTACTSTATAGTPAAAPAQTGPAQTAPADPNAPPHNQDWNNVSNINGQLVKVGESNEYLKTYKRWNISTNPVGMMLGYYGLSVSYGINNNIAVRADVNYMNPLGNDYVTGVEFGVGVPIYFKRTYQGLFLEPGLVSQTYTAHDCFDGCSASSTSDTYTMFGPQMLVGWHWTWDSGLNFALAAGAGRNWGKSNSYADPGVFPNGYMRFGYAF